MLSKNKEKSRKEKNDRYLKHKGRLWKEARKRYLNLSEKEQGKKWAKSEKDIKIFQRTKAETTWVYEKLVFST